jgi:hypothetical protein
MKRHECRALSDPPIESLSLTPALTLIQALRAWAVCPVFSHWRKFGSGVVSIRHPALAISKQVNVYGSSQTCAKAGVTRKTSQVGHAFVVSPPHAVSHLDMAKHDVTVLL